MSIGTPTKSSKTFQTWRLFRLRIKPFEQSKFLRILCGPRFIRWKYCQFSSISSWASVRHFLFFLLFFFCGFASGNFIGLFVANGIHVFAWFSTVIHVQMESYVVKMISRTHTSAEDPHRFYEATIQSDLHGWQMRKNNVHRGKLPISIRQHTLSIWLKIKQQKIDGNACAKRGCCSRAAILHEYARLYWVVNICEYKAIEILRVTSI